MRRALTVVSWIVLTMLLLVSWGPSTVAALGTLTWAAGPELNEPRVVTAGSASSGKVYVTGGFNGPLSNGNTLASVEVFDPAVGKWVAGPALVQATKHHGQASAPNGHIFVVGGIVGSTPLNTVQELDPAGGGWATRPGMLEPRAQQPGVAVAPDGKVYAFGGGNTANPDGLASAEVFDGGSWKGVKPMPGGPRWGVVAATGKNGKIYVIGGIGTGTGSRPSGIVEEYDPSSGNWTRQADMPTGRYSPAVAVDADGVIYVIGGYALNAGTAKTVEAYDPAGNAWTRLPDLATARRELGAGFARDGKLYAAGGADPNDNILKSVDVGTPGAAPSTGIKTTFLGFLADRVMKDNQPVPGDGPDGTFRLEINRAGSHRLTYLELTNDRGTTWNTANDLLWALGISDPSLGAPLFNDYFNSVIDIPFTDSRAFYLYAQDDQNLAAGGTFTLKACVDGDKYDKNQADCATATFRVEKQVPVAVVEGQSFPSVVAPSQIGTRAVSTLAHGVNAVFGNFIYQHEDLTVPSFGPRVRISRTYNSAVPKNGILGYGWNLTYDQRVTRPSASEVAVKRGDGRVDRYTVRGDGSLAAPPGSADVLTNQSGIYTLVSRDQLTYRFDGAGRLTSAEDSYRNTVTLSYAGDNWTGIADTAGRRWTLDYDANGRVSAITDPTQRRVSFTYNSAGDLISVANPEGGVARYSYDGTHRLLRVSDTGGKLYTENTYDEAGRVTQQKDARGTHGFAYESGATTYTDPIGGATRVEYDTTSYRVTKRTDPLGNSVSLAYDSAGLVSSQTAANGGVTRYDYDSRGNQTSITNALGGVTSLSYDARNNLTRSTDPLGRATTYAFGGGDQLLSSTGPLQNTFTYAFDNRGLLLSASDVFQNTTTYTYDSFGNRTGVRDPRGGETSISYDLAGRVTEIRDPEGLTYRYTYNQLNQLLTRTSPDGGITRFEYDASGNQTGVVDPRGGRTTNEYDAANALTLSTDPRGRQTYFEYDTLGELVIRMLPDGSRERTTYDAGGRVTSTTSASGDRSSYKYDKVGNRTSATDARGNVTVYTYNALNQLTSATETVAQAAAQARQSAATTSRTEYTYDAVGNRTSAKDPRGNVTTYAYNAANRLISTTDPSGQTEVRAYDAGGRVASTTNPAGQTLSYIYDAVGRILTIKGPGVDSSYTYDAAGRRTAMTDAAGTTAYSYDAAGRPANVAGPQGTVSYSYDTAGNRTGLNQPGASVTYGYDAANRLESVKLDDKQVARYGYDAAGREQEDAFGNGLKTTRGYDASGRLTSLVTGGASGDVLAIQYGLDGNGNRVREISTGFSASYLYDTLGRLTKVGNGVDALAPMRILLPLVPRQMQLGAGPSTRAAARAETAAADPLVHLANYSYDESGNRVYATEGGNTRTTTYDAANRITSPGFAYDAAGRLSSDGVNSYSYDARNRLSAISGGVTASFVYDGDGNRVAETVNGVATTYLLDRAAALPVRIAATSGGATERYVYGLRRVVQVAADGSVRYEHADGLGSLRLLTDARGAEVQGTRSHYGPFGQRLAGSNRFGFTGEPQDPATGLVYLRARDYSPALGRFLTPDPLPDLPGLTQTLNHYTYVRNNPVNATDPTGLVECGMTRATQCYLFQGDIVSRVDVNTYVAILIVWGGYDPGCNTRDAACFEGVVNNLIDKYLQIYTPPPPPPVPPAPQPRPTTENARLQPIRLGGVPLAPSTGTGLVAPGIANLPGASLVGNSGGTLIGNDGAGLIGNDGAGLIGNDGAGLIGNDGAGLIGNDGASLIGNRAS